MFGQAFHFMWNFHLLASSDFHFSHRSLAVNTKADSLYRFGQDVADGDGSMRIELGGKGAALQELARLGLPVPPGFTIPTSVCRTFLETGQLPNGLHGEISDALRWLEDRQKRAFGSIDRPLLVSVRSGAAVSMPGMMDTILNVGLNDDNLQGFARDHGNLHFALDSYRRLLQMFGSIVLGVPKEVFASVLEAIERTSHTGCSAHSNTGRLQTAVAEFHRVIEKHTGNHFPADPRIQLDLAIAAVFNSWNTERARHYRRIHCVDEMAGTAVTVQAMVFGNRGLDSGTGVGFSRNPSTGEPVLFGEFLFNAQGEDIVAGTDTPMAITELAATLPEVYRKILLETKRLETHFRDVQDFEFTVEQGKLFFLQTRGAKQSPAAVIRSAVEMAEEGLISEAKAIKRVPPQTIHAMLLPQLDLGGLASTPIAQGLAASPGSAVGQIVFTADRAVELAGARREHPVILVRRETSAEDIHGMDAAVGFVTAHGGATSHAAVVARGMGKCCITGADGFEIDAVEGILRVGALELKEGDWLSIDGSTGRIFAGRLALRSEQANNPWLIKLLKWSRERIGSSVRANADTPEDAARAHSFGGSGIGLCRTEHMFFSPERLPHMRAMILAENERERKVALDCLLPMQQQDFEKLFHKMAGLPVTIRLIDPPLHEFLPTVEELNESIAVARREATTCEAICRLELIAAKARELRESNPMMGHRGCRLGITYPEVITMQTRAILRAAIAVSLENVAVHPEIMIPLVSSVEEIRFLRQIIAATAKEVFVEEQLTIPYWLGTMIELPRAALCARAIAPEVDFLSFGTNDLTQMTFGFSRDDAQKYLEKYLELGVLREDPFLVIDKEGVGELMRMAILDARQSNPAIKIGVCGEHGGEPGSIEFFASLGVDYVSTSPARIPVAQLAMAQSRLKALPESMPYAMEEKGHAAA